MVSWLIGIIMLVSGCINDNSVMVLTSGLFVVAGNIGFVADAITTNKSNKNANTNKQIADNK